MWPVELRVITGDNWELLDHYPTVQCPMWGSPWAKMWRGMAPLQKLGQVSCADDVETWKRIYIFNQNIKDTSIFININIYIYIYTVLIHVVSVIPLCFLPKQNMTATLSWSLIDHRGCRLPWSTALFHRWPGFSDRNMKHQWMPMVFRCFREQRDGKATGLKVPRFSLYSLCF